MLYNEIDKNKRKTWLFLFSFSFIIIGLGTAMSFYFNDNIIVILAIIVAFIISLIGWFTGDSIILSLNSAKSIKKKDNPELYRIVENLAITAGLPNPKIYIIEDPAINAFATGRDPMHASVAISRGALEKLDKNEISGVIAHELSHIKNYDIRLLLVVITIVGFISILSDVFLRIMFRSSKKDRKGNGIILIIAIALAILSPLIAKIIQLAISRQREFLADADAALLTRYPEGLASALEKIKNDTVQLKHFSKTSANLFIASPFAPQKKSFAKSLFDTHPDINERIQRLRNFNF